MLGSNAILFPDGSDDFMRCLKYAVLYHDKVRVLSPLFAQETLVRLREECTSENEDGLSPSLQYLTWSIKASAELRMLKKQGLLEVPSGNSKESFVPPAMDRIASGGEEVGSLIDDLVFPPNQPPGYIEMIAHNVFRREGDRIGWSYAQTRHLFRVVYFMGLTAIAERDGLSPVTYGLDHARALWLCRGIASRDHGGRLSRLGVESKIGQTVLERHLPRVDDLPMEEVLSLRQKRADEIDAFRVGVRKLATQVDVTQPTEKAESQIHDLISREVDPAIQDLKGALKSSRLDALTKIGQSSSDLAAATIPAVIAYAAGVPLNMAALAGAVGPVVKALWEGHVAQQKLLHASQWAFIVRLDQVSKKRQ